MTSPRNLNIQFVLIKTNYANETVETHKLCNTFEWYDIIYMLYFHFIFKSAEIAITIIIKIFFFIRHPVLHSRGPSEIMIEKKHELGVSRLVIIIIIIIVKSLDLKIYCCSVHLLQSIYNDSLYKNRAAHGRHCLAIKEYPSRHSHFCFGFNFDYFSSMGQIRSDYRTRVFLYKNMELRWGKYRKILSPMLIYWSRPLYSSLGPTFERNSDCHLKIPVQRTVHIDVYICSTTNASTVGVLV